MYLFFDTETTGLPKNWKAKITDFENWPRLVQLAYVLYDDNGIVISTGNHIVKPEGFTIPEGAAKVHGISTEKANQIGEDLKTVLQKFQAVIDQTEYLVAHNMNFDEKVLGAEFLRNDMVNGIEHKTKICTMISSKDFCAIENSIGIKFPSLAELYLKLFNSEFEGAHNALADITATAKCFWELKKLGEI
jgi:DNA polymerase III epsilon subunit-like protein